MKTFANWFNSFFLATPAPDGGLGELIEAPKSNIVYLRWLFGATIYFSIAGFFFWILGLSSIHMSQHMKEKNIFEKLFFFANPTVWKNYVIGITGGFFNIYRKANGTGERIFLFLNLGLIGSSLANLCLSLSTINLSASLKNSKLRLICIPLCFPALGCLASILFFFYFLIEKEESRIRVWSNRHPILGYLAKKYFNFQDNRAAAKKAFKPKTMEFLTFKEKPKTLLDYLNRLEEYALSKH